MSLPDDFIHEISEWGVNKGMKQFKKWLVEMDGQEPGGMPPPNGGVTPSVPPEVASELSAIAEKLNALIEKLGIGNKGSDSPDKGLGDKGPDDKDMGQTPGPPPNFQT